MNRRIDLNADVGEGSDDAALYPLVTSVNIACGAHAGDSQTMAAAVALAVKHGCAIGAHPGYADPEHMGRRAVSLSPAEIVALVATQVRTLQRVARDHGTTLHHVKPHGALYNLAAADAATARAVATGVAAVDAGLILVGLAGSESIAAAGACGLQAAAEAFCDRGYRPDGSLIPRDQPGAVVADPEEAAVRAVQLAGGAVDTLCLHSDTPGAVAMARAVRQALEKGGISVRSL